jgi:glycosyltransferase involved in cell wall biosynthesis
MDSKLPLSVALISYNEEENIARTLSSVANIASEIVLVDSYSTDNTVAIAKKFGANVFQEEWKGHIAQKNSALQKCTQPWILALDCDEVVTPELKQSIIEAVNSNSKAGFLLHRKTYYLGKLLHFSWQPDWKLRLVRKDCNPRWEGINPHDALKVDCPTKKLKGYLIHYSYKNLGHHIDKTVYYAKISAKSYFELGKKFSFFKLLFNPFFAFIKLYFFNLGFLDGFRGFLAGVSAWLSTFLKYAFLWELNHFSNDSR